MSNGSVISHQLVDIDVTSQGISIIKILMVRAGKPNTGLSMDSIHYDGLMKIKDDTVSNRKPKCECSK